MKTRSAFRSAFSNPRLLLGFAFCSIGLLLATSVRGQSALDGFDPNANGAVYVVVVQPDGKILIGGDFTTLSPNGGASVTRNHIARLNPDGTLDTAFNPNANGTVYSIAVQADGKILVGGDFTSIGGQTRNHIARLDATTGLADSFDPNANGAVYSIAVQADGKILAGGDFTSIGGQTRNRIARLDATTGLADSFNPNANSTVHSIAVQADGKILVGGDFTTASADRRAIASPGSMPRPAWLIRSTRTRTMLSIQSRCRRTARFWRAAFSPASADRRATTSPGSMPRPAWLIRSTRTRTVLSIQSRCRRTARFWWAAISRSIGGQTRNRIARLDATTGLADSFDPNANSACLFNRGAGGRQDFSGRRFHRARTASADRRATTSPGWKPTAGSTRRSISAPSAAMLSPPPFSRTARFSSAASLPPFWAWRATTLHD